MQNTSASKQCNEAIQEAIQNVLGPVTQLRVSAVKQRDELPPVEVPEDKAAWKSEFDKMDAISNNFRFGCLSSGPSLSENIILQKTFDFRLFLVGPQKSQNDVE